MDKAGRKTKLIDINNTLQIYMRANNIDQLDTGEILKILKETKFVDNYQQLYQYLRRKALFGTEFQENKIIVKRVHDYKICFSVQYVAELFNVSKQTIYNLVKDERIIVKKIGETILITTDNMKEINKIFEKKKREKFLRNKNRNKEVPQWD